MSKLNEMASVTRMAFARYLADNLDVPHSQPYDAAVSLIEAVATLAAASCEPPEHLTHLEFRGHIRDHLVQVVDVMSGRDEVD